MSKLTHYPNSAAYALPLREREANSPSPGGRELEGGGMSKFRNQMFWSLIFGA